MRGTPRVVNVVVVIVRNAGVPVGDVGCRQNGPEPDEVRMVVDAGPEETVPVAAVPARPTRKTEAVVEAGTRREAPIEAGPAGQARTTIAIETTVEARPPI